MQPLCSGLWISSVLERNNPSDNEFLKPVDCFNCFLSVQMNKTEAKNWKKRTEYYFLHHKENVF